MTAQRPPGNQRKHLYSYRGLSDEKKLIKGQMYAGGEETLDQALAEKNIYMLSCRRQPRPRAMKIAETTWLLDQLQLMLQAGLSVPEALRALREHASPHLRAIVASALDTVECGYGLAAGIRPHLKPRHQVTSHLIDIGEHNGQLPLILERLVAENRHIMKIRQNIIQSLSYPLMLIIIAVCVVSAMMVWVIPEFKKIYDSLGTSLPVYTLIMIRMSEWLSAYAGYAILSALGFAALLPALVRRWTAAQWLLARLSLRLPFFGELRRAYLCRCFASHLGIIYRAGVTLDQAFSWLPATSGQAVYCSALKRIHKDIRQGCSLQQAVRNSGFFPPLIEQIITSGESSGTLEQALTRIEDFYAANLHAMAGQLPRLLEPILIVAISAVVGWIIISLYLPVFNLGFAL